LGIPKVVDVMGVVPVLLSIHLSFITPQQPLKIKQHIKSGEK